jgi:hypothetical protein
MYKLTSQTQRIDSFSVAVLEIPLMLYHCLVPRCDYRVDGHCIGRSRIRRRPSFRDRIRMTGNVIAVGRKADGIRISVSIGAGRQCE